MGFGNGRDGELGRRIFGGEEWVGLFDTTSDRNEGKNCGCTNASGQSDARDPGSAASKLPDRHKNKGTADEERLEPVYERGGITNCVAGMRVEQRTDDENDDRDSDTEEGLWEISCERGKSNCADYDDERQG